MPYPTPNGEHVHGSRPIELWSLAVQHCLSCPSFTFLFILFFYYDINAASPSSFPFCLFVCPRHGYNWHLHHTITAVAHHKLL